MKILADMHNLGLYYSLQLLFEKRLKGELYRPVGMDWFNEGYFKIAEPYGNNPSTIAQFLEVNSSSPDGLFRLNDAKKVQDGVYEFIDLANDTTNKGITLETFKNTKFDIIIASIPQHIEPFKELVQKYQPQAKFVFQCGNVYWDKSVDYSKVPNLLASVKKFDVPPTCNTVWYHQEFDLEIFQPQGKKHKNQIVSFVNSLPTMGTIGNYMVLKNQLPEFGFKSYGIGCDDGIISGTQEIANIMNESYFGIHLKHGGDGMGHIIHNWFACGKPVIVNYETYKNQLAGELMVPDETCFALDGPGDVPGVIDKIRKLSPIKYEWMCQQSYQKFKEVCNFDKEEVEIRKWLDNLN